MSKCLMAAVALLATLAPLAGERWVTVTARDLRGEPERNSQTGDALYIWTDAQGLHLRWRAGSAPRLFTGRLDTNAPIEKITRADDLAGGWAREHGKQRMLFSSTVRAGKEDGVDISAPRAGRADLLIDMDGSPPPTAIVFLGSSGAHPTGLPMRLSLR